MIFEELNRTNNMILIGIDTGVKTGIAIWSTVDRLLIRVDTMTITKAMDVIKDASVSQEVLLYIEDARLRKFFGNSGREKLQGAGSIKRDAKVWEDWCIEQGFRFHMVAPVNNRTKLSSVQFRNLTKWEGRTSEHSRDAAMLVFGRSVPEVLLKGLYDSKINEQ